MLRPIALALTVLTGFSGLVYEVAWQKYLATLLGSHSTATSAVLALFLGGLALGYAAFGALSRRVADAAPEAQRSGRLLLLYGAVEAGIGAYALLFAFLFRGVHALSFRLPTGGGLGFALDVLLSALLIVPPALLMGATIPVLTQALARSLGDATRIHARIYAWNTAGAFAGALAAGFWLVPWLGLAGVGFAMGCVNLAAGAAFAALSRASREPARLPLAGAAAPPRGAQLFAAIALLGGFATMAIQTVLIRLGGLALGASHFTFSMVVAVFVLCIALGSFGVSALGRIPRALLAANLWALLLLLCALHTQLDAAPYWAHALRGLFRDQPAGFYPYYGAAFLGVLLVLGPAVALAGAALPLIFHQLRREVSDLGAVAGRLYAWNTLGCLLGALLGGHVLLYWLDLDGVFRVALLCLALAAALATARVLAPPRRARAGLLLLASLALVAALPGWSPERLASGLFRKRVPSPYSYAGPGAFFRAFLGQQRRVPLFYDDGPVNSVAVTEHAPWQGRVTRVLVNNGKSDGSSSEDYLTMALSAIVPALFAERAESAFVIGYGVGVTAGEFAALESAREVVVAEISPSVIAAAPLFDDSNLKASRNPVVRIVQGDAYRTLMRSGRRFDVIASEPSNPWVVGVEMLYSLEFLQAARAHLAPGGVYAQWIHTYEIDEPSLELVLRTYARAFDHVAVWYLQAGDLLLLGFQDARRALDLERLEQRAARPDFAAALKRSGIASFPALLAHELLPLGVVHAMLRDGEIHTLLHPRLSHRAARAFFAGSEGGLPFSGHLRAALLGRRHALVGRYAARTGGRLPEAAREDLVRETCRHRPHECVTLLAQWSHEEPRSERREAVVAALRLPSQPLRIPLEEVAGLARLYGGGATEGGRRDPLERAVAATQAFWTRYHHAAPFSREVLAQLWDRCEAEPRRRANCEKGRAQAQLWLGPLVAAPPVGGS